MHKVAAHGWVGALVLDAPLADGAGAAGVVGAARVPHQEHHAQPQRGIHQQALDLPQLDADRLDELDGEERADGVQVLRHQTQHVVGQQIVARVPQPEVVVLKQELVVRLGHVVKVSNILFIELTFKKTLQKLSLILLGFHSTSLVFRF